MGNDTFTGPPPCNFFCVTCVLSIPVTCMSFDDLKSHNGRTYTGMPVGRSHHWVYPNGTWKEEKVSPDEWRIDFRSVKNRKEGAPPGSGAGEGSRYHWYIVADQQAVKLDKDSYETHMYGCKFKVGHMRPYWRKWSYEYPEQRSYREMVISILERKLAQLRSERINEEVLVKV